MQDEPALKQQMQAQMQEIVTLKEQMQKKDQGNAILKESKKTTFFKRCHQENERKCQLEWVEVFNQ